MERTEHLALNQDTLFSNWTIAWFILYYFHVIDYNPTLILLICQAIMVMLLFTLHQNFTLYFDDCLGSFIYISISKILPVFLLWMRNDVQIKHKDIYFSFGFCALYILYLYFKNTSFIQIYTQIAQKQKCKETCTGKTKT